MISKTLAIFVVAGTLLATSSLAQGTSDGPSQYSRQLDEAFNTRVNDHGFYRKSPEIVALENWVKGLVTELAKKEESIEILKGKETKLKSESESNQKEMER